VGAPLQGQRAGVASASHGDASHLCVSALLVADEHEQLAIHATNATNNCWYHSVQHGHREADELVSYVQDDIKAGGPVGVTGHLQALCWGQPAVGLLS